MAVDLGITKTVTENGEQVTYKLLWSPFNYGVESKVDLKAINQVRNMTDDEFVENCHESPGMRLDWGALSEPDRFFKNDYNASDRNKKYPGKNQDITVRTLRAEDDIVQQNWPEGWYIPTAEDYQLLGQNTTITAETHENRKWFRLTGKGNYASNSILIPATRYIDNTIITENTQQWFDDVYLQSATAGTLDNTIYVFNINNNNNFSIPGTGGRGTGLMIRPVKYVRQP